MSIEIAREYLSLPLNQDKWPDAAWEMLRDPSAFLSVDWCEETENIVNQWNLLVSSNFVVHLKDGDRTTPAGFAHRIVSAESEIEIPYRGTREDCMIVVITLNRLFKDRLEIRLSRVSTGNSDWAYLPLRPEEWVSLESEFGAEKVSRAFAPLEETWERLEAELDKFPLFADGEVEGDAESSHSPSNIMMIGDQKVVVDPPKVVTVASLSAGYGNWIIFARWFASWIDFITLLMFIIVPSMLLPEEWYQKFKYVLLILMVLYFPVTETLFGKSVGRVFTRTRVVNSAGEKPALWQSIVRTVLRFFEVNPFLAGGVPAGLITLASSKKQRLGDMLAGTYVIADDDLRQLTKKQS